MESQEGKLLYQVCFIFFFHLGPCHVYFITFLIILKSLMARKREVVSF